MSLLTPQRLDRIQPRGVPGRDVAERDPDPGGEEEREGDDRGLEDERHPEEGRETPRRE